MITATLRGLTIGENTDYPFPQGRAPSGFGVTARQSVQDRMFGGQMFSGRDVNEGATLTFEVYILGDSPTDAMAMVDALTAAWAPSPVNIELTVALPGSSRVYVGRPKQLIPVLDDVLEHSTASALATFTAVDSIWYSSSWRTATLGIGADPTGGFASPFVSPFVSSGGGGPIGDVSVYNGGTVDAAWVATIYGPVTTPRLILDGVTIQIDGDVLAGEVLVVDSTTRLAVVDGITRPWISYLSEWWLIPPGSSTLSFRAVAGTGTLSIAWRDASF